MSQSNLTKLTNVQIVSRMTALCRASARLNAEIVSHLAEVETRGLHLERACSSMFDFCVRRMQMSEGAAYRRINAARLVRRFPCLLQEIATGKLHLSGLVLLRDHLTEANVEEVIAATRGKSVRELEELLAVRAPKRDVRDRVRPLSKDRFQVMLTVSRELRDKLERARDLMSHRNPTRDLAVVLDTALDVLLTKLEKQRHGKATRPRPDGVSKDGSTPRSARRQVFARDGEQCTFTDESGNRCPARAFIELDHIEARAFGGEGTPSNLRLLCKPHNRFHAEEDFGREHVQRSIDSRRQTSDSPERTQALSGLVNLGFKRGEATRALDTVLSRCGSNIVLPDVLREAIGLLTTK